MDLTPKMQLIKPLTTYFVNAYHASLDGLSHRH